MRRLLAALAATLTLSACGADAAEQVRGGGRVFGEALTISSLLPATRVAQDIVDGQKLALARAGGTAGPYRINFAAKVLRASGRTAIANAAREVLRDPQIVAAIADLDSGSARVSIPLFNESGILHLSPGATYPGFVAAFPGAPEGEPERWQPGQARTFASLAPNDLAQVEAIARLARPPVLVEAEADDVLATRLRARLRGRLTTDPARARTVVYAGGDPESARGVVEALAREAPRARILLPEGLLRSGLEIPDGVRARFLTSAPAPDAAFAEEFRARFGRCASRFARLGHDAMSGVLAAIRTSGARAAERARVAEAWFASEAPARAARAPFELVSSSGC